MPDDRLLKPLPAESAHYALAVADCMLIMGSNPDGGHSSVLELRDHGRSPSVDMKAIADLICRYLTEQAAALRPQPNRVPWDSPVATSKDVPT